jgi:phospholipid-translocating P-type ATPase (flippase)
MIQGVFIGWDILLYSKWRHCFCNVKTISIIEELGNVNFIFSDKTGTLTKNQLQFKYCIIENKYYEYIKIGGNFLKKENTQKKNSTNTYDVFKKYRMKKNSFISENNQLLKNKVIRYNIIDNNLHFIKKNNYNIQTENVNMPNVYKKFSGKNINRYKLNRDDHLMMFNSQSQSNSPPSPKSKKDKKQKTKSIECSYSKGGKNKSHSNISIVSINNSNNINTNSNRTDSNNSNSYSSNNNDKNNNNSMINLSNINNKIEELLKRQNNSTILEARNEENESGSIINEITQFGEGFFVDFENNPFLKKIQINKSNSSFNYVNEFWTALALTNECIIKYEKGELKYMGTSPDDLELVKTAASQGYKLIETSINTKTLRIGGKNCPFEILKVLGFSSERKRMSIIVKDKNEIKLYTKGADCEISKRLSKKSLKNENYEIISKGLIEFSKKGLRTLMVAFRRINEEDYYSWVSRLHEDEFNMQNKQKLIERLYDIIENNLILIGGTVVEDKLQDNVPKCIKEIRAAGIKLWVLTGDKLDTAENIGYSCNLLSKEQKLFTLKLFLTDEFEDNKEEPFLAINQFFFEFQEYIEGLVKKYNLDSKYNKKHNYDRYSNNIEIISEQSQSQHQSEEQKDKKPYKSSNSSISKIIDFETFNYLKEKNFLEPFSIIIESPILAELFTDEEYTYNFIRIAYYSNTVICCRISPSQKSEVINRIKNFDKKAITLAIGDGGNDVSMIMEANIGIGIHGEEGTSAAQASDFSIGEFQLLKRLLFIHGRINLYRISEMILYFFFKNFIFTMSQFFFSFICLASGQTIIDDWYITCYNLVFTAFPLCVRAITDTDIDLNDKKNIKKNLAILYQENRDKYKIFSFKNLIWKLNKALLISFISFISCCVNEIFIDGYNKDIWYISLKCYICILIIVSLNLLINSSFIAYLLPITIGVTTFLLFIIFLVLNHYGIFFEFNSKASIFTYLKSPLIYLSIFLICSFDFILDYSSKLFKLFLRGSLINKLILKKSFSTNGKMNVSKPNSKHSRNKDLCSSIYDDRSRSILLSKSLKSVNKLKEINNNIKDRKRSYFNHNYNSKKLNQPKSKFGETFKNDFYSLKILKNINNNNNSIVNKNDNIIKDNNNV